MKNGFTLIELMIVVTIIGILAAIAYPSYQEYIIRTHRADVQAELMRLAGEIQKYKIVNHSYKNLTKSSLGIPTDGLYPYDSTVSTARYEITFGLFANSQTYRLQAIPKNSQAADGIIRLDSDGQRCWIKGHDMCTPSATSNWDN